MKNIIDQTPRDVLHNMVKYSTMYLKDQDVKSKKVLDIGCGYGWFEIYALSKGATTVTGTEISQEDLITAKKYVRGRGVSFTVGDATKLPFRSATFDTVVTWEVLEHIPVGTELKMFSEIKRVLKKGGVCYLSTPHRSFFSNAFDPAFWIAHHRHYSKDDITRFANTAGLHLSDIRIIGGFWLLLFMVNLYISKWIFHRSPFWRDAIMKRVNSDYTNSGGFYNIYCTLKKV